MECEEFLGQKKIGAVLMESTHEEDQTDKQGLHQKTGVTMSYIQYVLGEAASEEF